MKWFKTILRFFGWGFLLFAFYYVAFLKSFLLGWGSHKTERTNYYQGDSIVANPGYVNTLAITVDKPPSGIWPWIAQMGLNKAGFYTYTWLENIFGCNLQNANSIHPEWQNPNEGDYEPVCASAENNKMPGWTISMVNPGKALVFRSSQDSSWTMGFYVDSINTNTSRLVTRMRYNTPKKFWEYIADKLWLEWAHCIMQRGSINGIKKRAENNNPKIPNSGPL